MSKNLLELMHEIGSEFYEQWQQFWAQVREHSGVSDQPLVLHISAEDWPKYSNICSWLQASISTPRSDVVVIKQANLARGKARILFHTNEHGMQPVEFDLFKPETDKKEEGDNGATEFNMW